MRVTVMYLDGCPNWETAHERVTALGGELGFTVDLRKINTAQEAEQAGFGGSPTILVNGRDVFAHDHEPVGLSCRVYQTPQGPAGAPTLSQLRDALA